MFKIWVLKTKRGHLKYERFFNYVFFYSILVISIEGNLEFLICAYLNIYYNNYWDFSGDRYSVVVAYIGLFASFFLIPAAIIKLFTQDTKTLRKDKSLMERFGPLTHELKLRDRWDLSFFAFFWMRRLVFVATAFFMTRFP
jgi:hypothetical protein